MTHKEEALKEIHRVLKTGGKALAQTSMVRWPELCTKACRSAVGSMAPSHDWISDSITGLWAYWLITVSLRLRTGYLDSADNRLLVDAGADAAAGRIGRGHFA